MSAFVVSDEHIASLVHFAAAHQMKFHFASDGNKRIYDPCYVDDAQALCEILFRENVRSVLARYPQDSVDDYPMTICYDDLPFYIKLLTPVAALKASNCLDYQSCETDDWNATDAYRALQWIESEAISNLDGYDAAAWEIQ